MYMQGCGNIESTTGHFYLFSLLLSCSPYSLYTVYFHFTGHSLDLSDNVLHDWLFPHHCVHVHYTHPLLHIHVHTHVYFYICMHTLHPLLQYIYFYTCTHTYTVLHVHVHYTHPSLHIHVHTHVYFYIACTHYTHYCNTYTLIPACTHIQFYMYMYIIHTHYYIYMYIHMYTFTSACTHIHQLVLHVHVHIYSANSFTYSMYIQCNYTHPLDLLIHYTY